MTSRDRNWTSARLGSLTGSQVKELLLVAQAPPAAANADEADRLLADISHGHSGANATLLKTATDEATPVEELTRMKDLAKVLIKEAVDGPAREAARLLYHLTVAAAYVHHAAAISGRPMRKQQELYERMAAQWTDHAIGDLFREAAARVARANE